MKTNMLFVVSPFLFLLINFLNSSICLAQSSFKPSSGSWFGATNEITPIDFSVNTDSDSIMNFWIYLKSSNTNKWFNLGNADINANQFELEEGNISVTGEFDSYNYAEGKWKWETEGEGTWTSFRGIKYYIPQFTSDIQNFPAGSIVQRIFSSGESITHNKELKEDEIAGYATKCFFNLRLASFDYTTVLVEIILEKDSEETVLVSYQLNVSITTFISYANLIDAVNSEIKGPCKFGLRISNISGSRCGIYYPGSYIALSDTTKPIITPPPNADFATDNTSGEAPLTVNFTDISTGEISTWYWSFGDQQTSSEQNPTHIYTEAGTYTVTLTVTGDGGTATETKADYITVTTPPPIADFAAVQTSGNTPLTVNFTDNSTGQISTWLWIFGDEQTSSEQNPTHIYTEAGTYTVTLTVTGDGGTDTETKTNYITVADPTNIAGHELNEHLRIYPNPANSFCTIGLRNLKSSIISLKVYNSKGELVLNIYNELKPNNTQELGLHISKLPAGLYYVLMNTDSVSYTQKLMIIR